MGFIAEHLGVRAAVAGQGIAALAAGLVGLAYLRGGLAGRRQPPVASSVALGADGATAAA